MSRKKLTRRDFVADAGKLAAGAIAACGFPTIVPGHVLGGPEFTPPSALLKRLARENKVVTQMGNQGHSGEGTRRIVEWVRAGVIGDVREVHIFTDRPARFWAQGLPRPAAAGSVAVTGNTGTTGTTGTT